MVIPKTVTQEKSLVEIVAVKQKWMDDLIVFFWSEDLVMLCPLRLPASALEVNIQALHIDFYPRLKVPCHTLYRKTLILSVHKGLSFKLFLKFFLAWGNMIKAVLYIGECAGECQET